MLFEQNSVYETLAQNKTSTLTNKEIRFENTLQTIVNIYSVKNRSLFQITNERNENKAKC